MKNSNAENANVRGVMCIKISFRNLFQANDHFMAGRLSHIAMNNTKHSVSL